MKGGVRDRTQENQKKRTVRARLGEIWTRLTPYVTSKGVYYNGVNNLYPNENEAVINSSPTALRASGVMASYISGKGVSIEEDLKIIPYKDLDIINEQNNYRITDIIDIASSNISTQGGVFFHIIYGINEGGEIYRKGLDILNYTEIRKGNEDSDENKGKLYEENWANKVSVSKKINFYYPYNFNQKVIKAQILADARLARGKNIEDDIFENIKDYRGQVYYLNFTPEYRYAQSPAHAIYNECDSEARIINYTNAQVRSGFLGKVVAVTQGLDEKHAEEVHEDLKQFLGAENSDSMYHVDVAIANDITKVIHFEQLKAQYDDKLFSETDKRILRNIFGAFCNVPPALVLSSDGALFGTNAETYKQMKIFYDEQTSRYRERLQATLADLGFPFYIVNITHGINDNTTDNSTTE